MNSGGRRCNEANNGEAFEPSGGGAFNFQRLQIRQLRSDWCFVNRTMIGTHKSEISSVYLYEIETERNIFVIPFWSRKTQRCDSVRFMINNL